MGDQVTELSHQFGVSVAVVHTLEWLKRVGWFPWLTNNSTTALRLISLIVALATSAGFKVLSGDTDHGFTVFIPPVAIIVDTLIHAVAQFGAQEGYYNIVIKADGILKNLAAQMQQIQDKKA
jgi:hypothetical protein